MNILTVEPFESERFMLHFAAIREWRYLPAAVWVQLVEEVARNIM